jgi:hypothetical protein
VVLLLALVFSAGCSAWRPYRYTLDRSERTHRGQPHLEDGECVVEVETTRTQVYKVRHRFRTGADLYAGAFLLTLGWIYAAVALAGSPPEGSTVEEHRRGALTAALVTSGISLPFWGFFLAKRINRPAQSQDVHEEVKTTAELEYADGQCR